MARCVGLKRDVRLNCHTTYNDYFFLNTRSFLSFEGDSLSRFNLRMYEILESTNIINQILPKFLNGTKLSRFKQNLIHSLSEESTVMEQTISHFKF